MKAKDFKTLESLLKEYGMSPGISTPVGQQSSGSIAKANQKSPSKEKSQSPTLAKTVSPTTAKIQRQQQAKEEPFNKVDAGEQELDTVLKDKDGNEVGTVVSKVGDKPNTDAVVIRDPKNKFRLVEPDEELFVDNPDFVDEGKLGSKLSKDRKLYKLGRKIKKLSRKHKLREQGEELIFEINFNNKLVAQQALDLPIKCGFEAETSWDSIYNSEDDDDGEWLDDYNWYDIEDFIVDQNGRSDASAIEESYEDWITDKAMEYEGDIIERLVDEREEDEDYLSDYVEQELDEDDIEEYKENFIDGMDEDQLEEFEDWDMIAWGRQYTEEEHLEDYKEWLREMIRDNGEAMELAYEEARDDYDIDRWASYEYGSWQNCLGEHSIYLTNPDNYGGDGAGLDTVANYLEDWASDNSTSTDVRPGGYHSGQSTDQSYWRVEDDSSIQTDGTGAEIISPVYKTPRKMLEEMKSLFSWLEDQDTDTNRSTGLHVTMSYAGTQGAGHGFKGFTNDLKINPVKLAVLLGDKYLLSTFGRENNSYAKSQYKNLEQLGNKLKANPDAKTIEQIENILSSGINRDKFSSINFKDQKDNSTGNQLIEFRIGGGHDYHRDYNKVVKAVIRYATTLQAAYSNKLYIQDYAKALYRLINNVGKISADDEERVKDRINPDVEAPAVDILKDYFSKDNYVEHLRYLAAAYNTLAEYQQLKNQQNEDVEVDGPDADRLQSLLKKAQEQFAGAVAQAGYDYNQGHNRATPNAKSIGILRSALKDFQLDYNKLSELINAHQDRIETGDRRSNLTPKIILGRIKNGVDKLFKKSVVQEPEYLTANQVEKLTQGMWNAIQSDEIKDSQEAIKFANLLADASGLSPDRTAAWVDEIRSQSANREYKEFHAKLQRDSYGTPALFTAGDPVDSKKLKALTDYLKKYPEWNHPVAKGHNPNITGDDSYVDNALSKMMIKMRSRWEHLEDIRQDNPGLYIDSMREIAKLVTDLVDANKTNDDNMGDKHKDLEGTEHAYHRDGAQYFGMGLRTAEQITDMAKSIENPNARMVWDEPVAYQLRDSMQNYLRSAYGRYYDMKRREGDGFYRLGPVPEIIKQRTDAIKEFLTGFDKVAQKLGFDSQSSEIANKKQLDQKQADFKKKHGPTNLVKVDGWNFGGDIFIMKRVADNLSDGYTDRDLAYMLTFNNSVYRSNSDTMLRIPSAHYFTALDAKEILDNDRYKGTWREPIAKEILNKFDRTYNIPFDRLDNNYVNINQGNIKSELKARGVEFTKDLGDGRIGMGDYGPVLPAKELEGPHGEPFSPSSAAAWRASNPELSKKIDAEEKKRLNSIDVQIPKAAGVEGNEEWSSSSIADATNWANLADYLKIERGVNDQGVNLLKKVYNQFDSNHNWRPEPDPDVCCMPRYISAVKAAKEYIEKNYTVSGGNYFRKNADGSVGDDVSAVHGNTEGGNNMENIFDKFDKLTLEEQLIILEQSKVLERPLTKGEEKDKEKYVKGMKKNSKDFKKRYGKDAKAVMYATATKMAKESVAEGAVPDNDRVTLLNKILADHFPASDLKSQMLAYWAIPDPSMLKDFRAVRAQGGDDACLRPVLRSYAQAKLPEVELKKVNLNESAINESPEAIQNIGIKLGQSQSIIKYIDRISRQSKCQNNADPRCKTLNARKERVTKMYNDLVSQLASQSKETYDQGVHAGKQGFIEFRKQVDSLLRKLALKINGKVEFLMVPDDYSESEVPTHNPHTGRKLNQKDTKKAVTEKAAIEGVINVLRKYFTDPEFDDKDGDGVKDTAAQQSDNADIRNREFVIEFLTDAANGNILSMEDVIAVGAKGGMPIASMDDIVEKVAKEKGKERYFKFYKSLDDAGIMKQTAENTTSGNVGPGELALLLLCAPAEKGKRGDLLVDGKEVEIKSGSYGGSDGTKSGGKFNSKRLEKGNGAGANLQNALIKYFKTQNIDFKKTYSTWVTSNTFSDYKFNPKTFNMPALSKKQIDDVWNPYFKHLNLNDEQVKDIAEIFALCTFNKDIAYDDHIAEVKKQMGIAWGKKDAYDRLLKGTHHRGQLKGGPLGQLIQALQFTSYQYSNDGNTKLHDTILYMNKANKAITTVSDVKDFYEKMSKGYLVTAKDISLTDTQQTAGHSITAGLLK